MVVVVEGEVLKEEELIEVDEGREQLPLVHELATAPLANALLEFEGDAVAIPQLVVYAALRYQLTLPVVLEKEHLV